MKEHLLLISGANRVIKNKYSLYYVFLVLIFTLIVKDVLIPRFFYLFKSGSDLLFYTLLDALFQFGLLIAVTFVYFGIRNYHDKNQAFLESRTHPTSFFEACGFKSIRITAGALYFVVAVLSFVAFQLFKNVYLIIDFSISNKMKWIPELVSIDLHSLIMIFIVHVLWASIAEELFYRSFLFGEVLKRNRILAYILSIFAFSLAHHTVEQIIQAVLLSFVLCIIYDRTLSVVACILIHAVYNLLGMVVTYIYSPEYGLTSVYLSGLTTNDYWLEAFKLFIFAVIIVIVLGFTFLRNRTNIEITAVVTPKLRFNEIIICSGLILFFLIKFMYT